MSPLPTDRSPFDVLDTPVEHAADHNTIHDFVNDHPADPAAHSGTYERADPDWLTVGEETFPRGWLASGAHAMTSQRLRLTYFTARKTEAVTRIRVITGNAGAGATPSLIRMGVWTADTDGALLAQVATTPNDTALLLTSTVTYTKSFSAGFTKTAGQRYAVGLLVVTATTVPQVVGAGAIAGGGNENVFAPRISAAVTGQADLPATLAAGSLAADASRLYFVLLP